MNGNITQDQSLEYVKALEREGFDLERYEDLTNKYIKNGFLSGVEAYELQNYEEIIKKIDQEFSL